VVEPDVVVYPKLLHWVCWFCVVGSILLWATAIRSTVVDPDPHGVTDQVIATAFAVALMILGAVFFWRFTRIKAVFGATSIKIVGFFRTRTIPRAEFRHLAASGDSSWAFLVTTKGDRVVVLAITGFRRNMQKKVDRLNSQLGAG
jgi:hypothetical protein